jgi:hypothetical protein
MSYGLKYNLVFRDSTVISNKLWQCNVYASGYSGAVKQMVGAESPVQISYKKQSLITAINGSELTLLLQATTTAEYDEFLTAPPLGYYIDVQYSTNGGSTWTTYWSGVNTTDTFTQLQDSTPYAVNLKFNCGLGELQWRRYENAGALMCQLETVAQVMSNCLSFLPYTKNIREVINVREDTMSDTLSLTEQLYVNDTAFYEIGNDGLTHGINCNKLLNYILTSINCRMYQSNGLWWIERIYERVNTAVHYFDITASSSFNTNNTTNVSFASGTLNWSRTINNSGYPKITNGSEKAVTQKQPILTYKFSTQQIQDLQLIPNPYFEVNPTATTTDPTTGNMLPKRWDRSTAVAVTTNYDRLEIVDPYESDVRFQNGYSFGKRCVAASVAEINANNPNFQVSPYVGYSPPLTYYIHAVRNPGDTYTNSFVILDPGNMQMIISLRHYFQIQFLPDYLSAPTFSQAITDAQQLWYGLSFVLPHQIYFKRQANNDIFFLVGQQQIQNSNGASWQKNVGGLFNVQATFSEMASNFPYQTVKANGQSTPYNSNFDQNTLANLIISSWNGSSCTPFYINIDTSSNYTVGFNNSPNNPFPDTPQPYWFDCRVNPPYVYATGSTNTTMSLSDCAIRNVDIQLKDNAQSATSNISFFSTSDGDLRWNELVVNAFLGDTDSTGYPGSFFVYVSSNPVNTGTWHNRTMGDTGQALVDIFFKNFAQIPSNYRKNLRGNVIYDNALQFFHSVVDEDATVYIQLGHTLDVKQNKYTTDMEEMTDLHNTITPIRSNPSVFFNPVIPIPSSPKVVTPITGFATKTPIKSLTTVRSVANTSYPL